MAFITIIELSYSMDACVSMSKNYNICCTPQYNLSHKELKVNLMLQMVPPHFISLVIATTSVRFIFL